MVSGRRAPLFVTTVALLLGGGTIAAGSAAAQPADPSILQTNEVQSLDGSGNNQANPTWGQAGRDYARVAPARYADGASAPVDEPNPRRVSNRVFNDTHQNVFSERRVTQWAFAWGQFLDHTFGLRLGAEPEHRQGETRNIPFDSDDPLEEFTNDLGVIPFTRSAPAEGTGDTSPRQQVNTNSSYIDAWAVYGGTQERLEWLREGPVDADMSNNSARLLLPGGNLPRRNSRGDAASAPLMELGGRLAGQPGRAAVAGDKRANENFGLQATHTLFAREHNRIVSLLPDSLTEEEKFQIARRVVIAEQQYVTYNEFLPSLGVELAPYTGYDPSVNAALTNEFATVGYRAHSMIHGEFEMETDVDRYTPAELESFEEQGLEVTVEGEEVEIAVPLNLAFFNPDLLDQLQVDTLLQGLGLEAQYKNDSEIDNQLRSVLFQIPIEDNPDCLDGTELPDCFDGVVDLGAIDIARSLDHGMPSYNDLRQAYGLAPKTSFQAITGEPTEEFPSDPVLTPGNEINDPDSVDVARLLDINGNEIPLDSPEAESEGTQVERRTTVAARLKAIYGTVDNLNAFVGMIAEQHLPSRDFGELQFVIWKREFENLRDGDRFFYGNDPGLTQIRQEFGVDFRRTLGEIIASNTDIPRSELNNNVFFAAEEVPAGSCEVAYTVNTEWSDAFQVGARITNRGSEPIDGWTLGWSFANRQRVYDLWDGIDIQGASDVAVSNKHWNRVIRPGESVAFGFNATWNNTTNARPTGFTLNNTPCDTG